MAFDNEKSVLLASLKKNNRGDTIDVNSISDASSGELIAVDIRQYFVADNGDKCPTKKGVRIPKDQLSDLVCTLSDLINE